MEKVKYKGKNRYKEFLSAAKIISKKISINVLIATMKSSYGGYPGPIYAASVLLTFPVLILFLIFSKDFAKGIKLVFK